MKNEISIFFLIICLIVSFCACADQSLQGGSSVGYADSSADGDLSVEDLFEWEYIEGGIKITKYKGESKSVVVPEIIEDKTVVSVGSAFDGNVVIESIVIPKTVDKVNLSGCTSLKKVEWTTSFMQVNSYGKEAFPEGIETIVLPNVTYFGFDNNRIPYTDNKINVKYMDLSSAKSLDFGVRDIEVNIDEVVLSKDIKYVRYDHEGDRVWSLVSEDYVSDNSEKKYELIEDSDRQEIFEKAFGEGARVTMK